MKIATHYNCWRRLLPTLAVLLIRSVLGQGIVYVQMPPTIRPTNQVSFPEDALGTYVGSPLPIIINGQTVCTFNPAFSVAASSTGAIIGQAPNLDFPDDIWVVPLAAGTEIGPDAAGYNWTSGGLLSAATDGGIIGGPPLTAGYFVDVESAYMGFDFQQDGQTYYGWMDVGSPYAFPTGTLGWIYDYAYETLPDTPIAAGAVPEPSTWALLAMSAMLVIYHRRKNL
jgi:hypothetical protein